jgi:hypothetical protein
MTSIAWVLRGALLVPLLLGASHASSQSELTAPSLLTIRAPTLSGGTSLNMVAASGVTLKGTIGQSSPLGNLTGFATLTMARTAFWPIAAMVDCRDPDDLDCDGLANGSDNCPYFNSLNQTDSDGNGIGDVCECSDQSGDGTVTVSDIVEINEAIFTPSLASPLCDGNHDRQCNVSDIVRANIKIFGGVSFCRRYPLPAP